MEANDDAAVHDEYGGDWDELHVPGEVRNRDTVVRTKPSPPREGTAISIRDVVWPNDCLGPLSYPRAINLAFDCARSCHM